jgi:hypothetical protein
MTEGVEKNGFGVFSILMSARRPSVRTAELFPPLSKYPVSTAGFTIFPFIVGYGTKI